MARPRRKNLRASRAFTPYQRIVRNARRGMGVALSREEARQMSMDGAIEAVADDDDERRLVPHVQDPGLLRAAREAPCRVRRREDSSSTST